MDINKIVDEILTEMPDKVKAYKEGNKGMMGLFVGETMKRSKGIADPKEVTGMMLKKLE